MYVRKGASLKYVLSRHSSAVALLFGSYMKRKFRRRRPAADSHEKRCLRVLYGCCLRVKLRRAGNEENSGQIASEGVPRSSTISSNWPISDRPGSRGWCPAHKHTTISQGRKTTDYCWRMSSTISALNYLRISFPPYGNLGVIKGRETYLAALPRCSQPPTCPRQWFESWLGGATLGLGTTE